ncbi:MAG: hypothetical protein AABY27_03640, partial [Pseudomonadota bacterium]
ATARVEVRPSTNPPSIIWVSPLGASVGLSAGQSRDINFNFSATVDGSSVGLPDNGDVPINYIRGNFSTLASGEIVRPIISCIYLARTTAYANYSCNVTAWYYDTPFYNWTIRVQMSSLFTPNFGLVNDSINFTYQQITNTAFTPDSINWTSLQVTSKNSTSTIVTITNNGNVRIAPNGTDVNPAAGFRQNYVMINSTILNGTSYETISPSNFTGSTGGSCNIPAPAFIINAYQNLSISVNKSDIVTPTTNTTSFCLKQLDFITLVPQNFSTALSVPPLAWTIQNNYI